MAYDINSIESLSFREGVRKRIQMYLGSDDIEGTYQALKEIINNSTDEALAGYGKKIEIFVDEGSNFVIVRDYGRGVPFGVREDGENVLVSIYTKSHTGGKFSNDSYKNASGLNGIGGSCVCLSSKEFQVRSIRNGVCASASFVKGELTLYAEAPTTEKNGTEVRFIPDPEVFSNGEIGFSYERICEDIKNISYLYSGITFEVSGKNADGDTDKVTYCAKSGIIDFVKDNIPKALHSTIMTASAETEADSVEIAFQWGTGKEKSYVFVNGLLCPEGGTPITGAKGAITKTVNNLANASFDGDKIREGLFYVVNCKVANPSFANQTKSKINNPSLRTLTSNAFTTALKEMAASHSNEFNTVVALLRKIEKADEAAERARNAILNYEKEAAKVAKQKMIISDKLKDAKKLGENSILAVVEGDSAGGSIANGRQAAKADNFGVLRLRGKVINCLNNSIEDILANTEVNLFLQALGITYGKKYDSKKLRYGKIGILTDADSDGSHIGLLIMALIIKLCPELIYENRLCWIRTPLFREGEGRNAKYYYTNEEMKNRQSTGGNIKRFKGLGELGLEDMKNTLFNEQNRRFDTISCSEEGLEELTALMGPSVDARKYFVMNDIDFGEL